MKLGYTTYGVLYNTGLPKPDFSKAISAEAPPEMVARVQVVSGVTTGGAARGLYPHLCSDLSSD